MQKILIIKHGSLGDIISSTAAIKSINNYYDNSSITILTAGNLATTQALVSEINGRNVSDNSRAL